MKYRFRPGLAGAVLASLAAILLPAAAGPAAPPDEIIEDVQVRGLRRMTVDAFIFSSGVNVGDPYDPDALRHSFRRLWDRGLFSDLKVESEEGDKGRIVIWTVTERPILVSIVYDDVKAVTRTNIEDRFRERNVEISLGSPLDRRKLKRGEDTITDLLGEKGFLDAKVDAEITTTSPQSSSVRFRILQGPRTKIKKIEFVGNEVFSDRKLKGAMKLTREHSLFTSIGGKDIYYPLKYDQDIGNVRELYQNHGYLDVEIRPPQVEIRPTKKTRRREEARAREEAEAAKAPVAVDADETKPQEAPAAPEPPEGETDKQRQKRLLREEKDREKKEKQLVKADRKGRKWVYLTVRVGEGPQYRFGELTSSGNTVFTDSEVRRHIPLRAGQVLSRASLDAGIELLRRSYGSKGYIYASIGRSVTKKEGDVGDVAIEIREDKAYYVDRIEFEGNTTTREKVLRREMRLDEGELVNKRKLDLSVVKLTQLSYNSPIEEPIIEPVPGTDRVRIRIKTEERGPNEIQIGGGFSGEEGFFFAGSYSTRNFLGRGQTLGVALQAGGRSSRYTLSFREPWFLGRPLIAGVSVFSRDIEFAQDATRSGNGGNLLLGKRIGDFGRAEFVYSFESIKFTDSSLTVDGETFTTRTTTQIASITPILSYDKRNNFFRPSRGWQVSFSSAFAGEYLGGENNFVKPVIQGTRFLPLTRKTFLAAHGEMGLINDYGAGSGFNGDILGIPQFERFFIGGDLIGPRVFETRSISPVRFISRDNQSIAKQRSDIIKFKGRDAFGLPIEKSCRREFDFSPNDRDPLTGRTFCENGLRRVLIGGDRYFIAQLEYNISPGGDSPFILAFFVDAGNVLAEDDGLTLEDMRVSAGIETRIYLPVFQAPLRFIYGVPIREERFDSTNRFQFSIGSSF